jgi:hypothetical protein
VQAKAKVPALQTGLEEAVNKLALASDSNQGALQIKKVVDSLKDTDAKQRHLKGVLFSRITSEKGTRPSLVTLDRVPRRQDSRRLLTRAYVLVYRGERHPPA